MIVLVAPYTGYNKSGDVHLGASKKIRFVISVLSKLSNDIILINSAHNALEKNALVKRKIVIDGVSLTEILPPTIQRRAVGKLLNLVNINEVVEQLEIEEQTGKAPELFWFYNAYAFEMLFANKVSKKYKAPLILEFEDWHFSRNRGGSLKPWIDYLFWRISIGKFEKVYAINANVRNIVRPLCSNVSLLPGVVPKSLAIIAQNNEPFAKSGRALKIGYFGGLSKEKGADIVLALPDMLSSNFVLHVTGSGSLSTLFTEQSQKTPDKLVYHGMVDDKELMEIIADCDIILNPHTPIAEFKDGLFPFKVIESIASGRMLISTELSFTGFEELAKGTLFVDHSVTAFAKAITEARSWFEKNKTDIEESSSKAIAMFGEESIVGYLKQLIETRTGHIA
ncbi:glycosyltransferase [Dyadobacter sp. CY347]|uniref:glycosyltransferase n=1 Tax=Dyadobacter sp. CY347 TaxID=2909336 RepID=UPI001F41292C|nr:glycosyltransferase [Dyadobacter sp. CY347]MCF2487364.1 glycosyltransferase [Dyadobacter sp. CY347]